jgi:hypothetical protein
MLPLTSTRPLFRAMFKNMHHVFFHHERNKELKSNAIPTVSAFIGMRCFRSTSKSGASILARARPPALIGEWRIWGYYKTAAVDLCVKNISPSFFFLLSHPTQCNSVFNVPEQKKTERYILTCRTTGCHL